MNRIILKCNRCQKLISVSEDRWKKLLEKWGTTTHVEQNYICKKCELPIVAVPDYEEKTSPEEQELLMQTIDGKPFNVHAVITFLKKIAIYRRMWKYAKVLVVKDEDLNKYYEMYMKSKEEEEKNK